MEPVPFALVGSGWRAAFFERVARPCPSGSASPAATRCGVRERALSLDRARRRPAGVRRAWRSLVRRLRACCTSWPGAASRSWPRRRPRSDIDGLRSLAPLAKAGPRIQVAEQYRFQPLHAARLAIVADGRLGTISQVQASVAHGYHGIDLIRRFLGVATEPVTITRPALRLAGRRRA